MDPYRHATLPPSPRWRMTLSRRAWWITHAVVLCAASIAVADWVRDCYHPHIPSNWFIDIDFRKFFAATAVMIGASFAVLSTVTLWRVRRRFVFWLPLAYLSSVAGAFVMTWILFALRCSVEPMLPDPP